jgi:hypothetical protein
MVIDRLSFDFHRVSDAMTCSSVCLFAIGILPPVVEEILARAPHGVRAFFAFQSTSIIPRSVFRNCERGRKAERETPCFIGSNALQRIFGLHEFAQKGQAAASIKRAKYLVL